MATRFVRIGSMEDIHQFDDGDFTEGLETDAPVSVGPSTLSSHAVRRDEAVLQSAGSSGSVTVITAIQAGGGGAIGFQYKSRTLTISSGQITAIGAESGWNDV